MIDIYDLSTTCEKVISITFDSIKKVINPQVVYSNKLVLILF